MDKDKIIMPISRKQAKELGLKRYFTGKPCKRSGHITERDVYHMSCCECMRLDVIKYNKIRILRNPKHKEQSAERSRKWLVKNKDSYREYKAEWYKENKVKLKEANKRNYLKNKEIRKKKTKEWQKNNPDKVKATRIRNAHRYTSSHLVNTRNRRARIRNADGKHTKDDIIKLLAKQKGKCINCLIKLPKNGFHVDHIMPLALGGSNWSSNLQILCASCNMKKWCKHPINWAIENGRLL